jgi:hypothetical protein
LSEAVWSGAPPLDKLELGESGCGDPGSITICPADPREAAAARARGPSLSRSRRFKSVLLALLLAWTEVRRVALGNVAKLLVG